MPSTRSFSINALSIRHEMEQPLYVTQDDAGLPTVGGDNHNRAALAGCEVRTPITEAG